LFAKNHRVASGYELILQPNPPRSHPENQTLEKMNWNIHALYELMPEEIKIVKSAAK
jgi:hypothetical protein